MINLLTLAVCCGCCLLVGYYIGLLTRDRR